ncbi:MAG: hypothetical protein WC083_05605 [Candidatus Methanomethylophilaceae archaeon]
MTSFSSVWQGFIIMIATISIGVMMSLAGGTILDALIDGYAVAGVYNVPPEWDQSTNINLIVNIYYALMYLIPVIGVACFVVTIFQRKRYDRYNDPYLIYEER